MGLPVAEGKCKDCGSDVLCDFPRVNGDYWYHCVNPNCINFNGVEVGDMEVDDENIPFIIWNKEVRGV